MRALAHTWAALLLCGCVARGAATANTTSASPATVETQPSAPPPDDSTALGPGARYASDAERHIVSELAGAAERIRSLRFKSSVPVVVEDPTAIRRYIAGQLKDDELDQARKIYIALGMLPADLDVRAMLLRVMGEQIMGYYDPHGQRLVIRDSVMKAFATGGPHTELQAARSVIVHELVHALQDQHLGLGEVIDAERTSDADTALRALVEGDANLAMLAGDDERGLGALRRLTRDPEAVRRLAELVLEPPPPDSELGRAPPIVRIPLLSAYSDGLVFAAGLHGAGGWSSIDAAHRRPPISTQQILHPEHYASDRRPVELPAPVVDALGANGYTPLPGDTLGELELRVFLAQGGASQAQAVSAAAGWAGDTVRVYEGPGGELAVLWLLAWSSPEAALQAAHLARSQQAGLPTAERVTATVVQVGPRVLIARGLPERYLRALRSLLDPAGGPH